MVDDTSPQLGGNLDVNTKNILFGDSSDGSSDDVLIFGAGSDLKIYHDGSNSRIVDSGTGSLVIQTTRLNVANAADSEGMLQAYENGAVELYYDNSKKLETTDTGAALTGTLTATGQLTGSSSNSGKYVRLYGGSGTGRWDIYGHGANLRISDNDSTGSVVVDRAVSLTDGVAARFGASNDLEIQHNGGVNIIDAASSAAISFRYGGNEQFFIGNAEFKGGDDKQIKLGTSDDLRLFHDGSNTYVQAYNTGNMYLGAIHNGDVIIRQNSQNRYQFAAGGFNPLLDNCLLYTSPSPRDRG